MKRNEYQEGPDRGIRTIARELGWLADKLENDGLTDYANQVRRDAQNLELIEHNLSVAHLNGTDKEVTWVLLDCVFGRSHEDEMYAPEG